MDIINWAKEYLNSNGYTVLSPVENVQTMPWSNVHKFIGYIWLVYY